MNWTPPTSESEWDECLSAYVDGELDADAVADLEAHLRHDAARRNQVVAIRKTSALLSAWAVDAPPLRHPRLESRRQFPGGKLRIAAGFAIGIMIGIAAGNARGPARDAPTSDAPTTSAVSDATAERILDAINESDAQPAPPVARERGWALVRSELEWKRERRRQLATSYDRQLERAASLAAFGITQEEVLP